MSIKNKFHVATRKGWFEFIRENNTWKINQTAFAGVPVSISLAKNGSDIYFAALNHGHFGTKLHRSDNAGKSWQEISTPKYVKKNDTDEAPSLELIWSLEYANHTNECFLWAGTIPGGLFYSSDQGESWQLNESLWHQDARKNWFGGGYDQPGIHSICVNPRNDKHVTVAVSCAGVWMTNDGGETWKIHASGMRAEYLPPEKAYDPNVQDPHRMVQNPSDPTKFWVQHHNGIFHSNDSAVSWQEITSASPSHFGFAVVTHPTDANIAWFVPAIKDECRIPVDGKMVVMRTSNGGQTFEQLTTGLPQEHAFDLVYRHGLDIDSTGDCLVMGSTTGNLWISEDQGEHWHSLSNNLPPIYSVRFVK